MVKYHTIEIHMNPYEFSVYESGGEYAKISNTMLHVTKIIQLPGTKKCARKGNAG